MDDKLQIKILADLDKKFGKGKIIKLGQSIDLGVETLPSGSLVLNRALSGGYAVGKIIEIFGGEGSGKTTLSLHAIASFQKKGGLAGFVDMEHAFNKEYAQTIGVDTDELYFTQPDHGEEALTIVEEFIKTGAVGLIVIDSVAALIPKAELEGEIGESKMGLHARMMSQAMRKLVGVSNKAKCTLIFINQTREKIGVMFGDPTTTTGGNALKFYASQRLRVTSGAKLADPKGEIFGNTVRVNVIKNKIGSPYTKAEFDLVFGEGIDTIGEFIDICDEANIISKAGGGWYSYGETKLGQGKANVKKTLQDNPELMEELTGKVDKWIANL
jgi:recombination protein RecA